ncbi:MAG: CTP synthase, partial [Chlamydiota bacterium]|nr:CTP synthase [Chlamydiota bacterium]
RKRDWTEIIDRIDHPKYSINIAVVGKYIEHQDAYKSIYEAIAHAGIHNYTKVKILRVDAERIEKDGAPLYLKEAHGILIPGGFGERGIEGKISAIQYAREYKIPFLGICLGMQCAVIEFARNVMEIEHANSTEFHSDTTDPVICLLSEQKDIKNMGGTMRLGASMTKIKEGSLAQKLYGCSSVMERHRHRYEFNNEYRARFEERGFHLSATTPDGELIEIVEITAHPFFIACQYHPEFQSKPDNAHPFFSGLVASGLEQKNRRIDSTINAKHTI